MVAAVDLGFHHYLRESGATASRWSLHPSIASAAPPRCRFSPCVPREVRIDFRAGGRRLQPWRLAVPPLRGGCMSQRKSRDPEAHTRQRRCGPREGGRIHGDRIENEEGKGRRREEKGSDAWSHERMRLASEGPAQCSAGPPDGSVVPPCRPSYSTTWSKHVVHSARSEGRLVYAQWLLS